MRTVDSGLTANLSKVTTEFPAKPSDSPTIPKTTARSLMWSGRRVHVVLRVLIVLAALISDGISIVNILSGYSYGYESPAFAMYLAIVDLALWVTVAYAPDWVWMLLVANLLPFLLIDSGYGGVPLMSLLALAFVAYSARRNALIITVLVLAVWVIAATVMREDTGLIFLSVFLPLGILALIPGVGLRYMNAQWQVDRQTIEEFDRRALASLEEQRTELARELHDIVAHDITVIAMQARAGAMSRMLTRTLRHSMSSGILRAVRWMICAASCASCVMPGTAMMSRRPRPASTCCRS